MKKHTVITILIALLLVAAGTVKAQQWKELHTGVTEDLYDICCIDTNTIFASGQNGVILKTTDGGETWEEKYRRPRCQITKMCFANSQVGYAFCDSVISRYSHTWSLLKTEDGGDNWQRTGIPQNSSFAFSDDWDALINRYVCSEMAFKGTDTVFVAISLDGLYRSLDGGESFEIIPIEGFAGSEVRGFYLEDNIAYLLWWNRRYSTAGIAKTEDGGMTWRRIDSDSGITCSIICFVHSQDKNNLRVFGLFTVGPYDSSLLDTHDGFQTFDINGVESGLIEYFALIEEYQKCHFTDQDHGIAFYVGKDLFDFWDVSYTEDNGSSWTSYSHGFPNYPNRLYDVDGIDTVFFISGENGFVARNQQFTLMDINEQDESMVSVYPNPMVDGLFVNCKEESNVTIFSITGEMLYNKKLLSEAIDVSSLEEGFYLIRITNPKGISCYKKLIKNH